MKFIYRFLFFISLGAMLFFSRNEGLAAGTFQLVNFANSNTAISGYAFSNNFDFLYSGTGKPQASIMGVNLPSGMNLSSVSEKGGGLYSFSFEGTPEKVGQYSLTLVLTDNVGALATQSYIFNVIEPSIIFSAILPDGFVGQNYLGIVRVDYVGSVWVSPSVLPGGLTSRISVKSNPTEYSSGVVTVELSGLIMAVGTYDINVTSTMVDQPTYSKSATFPLRVKETPLVSTPLNSSQLIQQTDSVATLNAQAKEIDIKELVSNFISEEKGSISLVDNKLADRLKGKILLQTELHGEAWYVNPLNSKKYYMANGEEAYKVMRYLGVGITNKNLEKIKKDKIFAKKHNGKIFLQVEAHGEAYYIDFSGNVHYLKDGNSAYNVMRELGLGITNNDLRKVDIGEI